ncbi:MAG: hypothetical protein HQ514_03530 [Rhodospirillales bacterium]|nr:hypothetical protein [Rhodospirillales bacterium]
MSRCQRALPEQSQLIIAGRQRLRLEPQQQTAMNLVPDKKGIDINVEAPGARDAQPSA